MQVVILSPHRDDAAFSCGLTMHALLAAGATVRIVNVCTRSTYAPYLSPSPADPLAIVSAARRREDDAFLATLVASSGADADRAALLDLDWLDAPDRWCMQPEGSLEPHELSSAEVDALRAALARLSYADLVLAPAALGGHVDHRLVHTVAGDLIPAERLLFYEDLPYACRMEDAERTPALGTAGAWRHLPLPGLAGLKRTYARCYPSQIADDVAEEMERYADSLGEGERFHGTPEALQHLTRRMNGRGTAL